nr:hypothetical protein CFP56_14453 [Quercus suber]
MEIISRRLEQLDSKFRGMQAMMEETLPTVQQPVNQGERIAHHQENHYPEAEVLQQPIRYPRPERIQQGTLLFFQQFLTPEKISTTIIFYSMLVLYVT